MRTRTLAEIIGDIKAGYLTREINPRENYIFDILQNERFFNFDREIVDVGCGPLPHVGYRLAQKFDKGNITFTDYDYSRLGIHSVIYHWITSLEPEFEGRELPNTYWFCGDVQEDHNIIAGKSGIIHGVIPRKVKGDELIIPDDEVKMKEALEGLFEAKPYNIAIYLHNNRSINLVEVSLVSIGVPFKIHSKVSSADFVPYKEGSLFIVNN